MLVTSASNGWPTDNRYLEPDHPLQQAIMTTVDDLAAEVHSHIGVDGCGAPAHVLSLVGLARAFRSIANGNAGAAGDAVYECMAKDGADGVFAAALPDGRAVALKIADGGNRARPPVMVAALRAVGIDVSAVEPLVAELVLGHGRRVGEVRAIAP